MEELVQNCQRRKSDADPRLVAKLYDEFVALDREADAVRKERNDNAASMKVDRLWLLALMTTANRGCAASAAHAGSNDDAASIKVRSWL